MLKQVNINDNDFIIFDSKRDYQKPKENIYKTFAFDTENIVIYKDTQKLVKESDLKDNINLYKNRYNLECIVWCWSVYDEINGFFATNNFDLFLQYLAKSNNLYGWCYNAKYDFSQIDYKLIAIKNFKLYKRSYTKDKQKNRIKSNEYRELHNSFGGARYQYEVCYDYKNEYRNTRQHIINLYDFMNILGGGLAKVLKSFNVKAQKTSMYYQIEDYKHLTQEQLIYINNDVEGLYYAIKKFNDVLISENKELSIFGKEPNCITAGGIAKQNLLKSIYPNVEKPKRVKIFNKNYPINDNLDNEFRRNYGYRGGLCCCNINYQGRLLKDKIIYKYDVNSEYPTQMYNFIGFELNSEPYFININDLDKYSEDEYYIFIYFDKLVLKSKYKYFYPLKNPITNKFEKIFNYDSFNNLERCFIVEKSELLFLISYFYDVIETDIKKVLVVKKSSSNIEGIKYPFRRYVKEFYNKKSQAKHNGDKIREIYYKLLLNSSYGKLAEKTESDISHFELSENGYIHLVNDSHLTGEYDERNNTLNVLMGAIITSMSRIYILSNIIKVCGDIDKNFIYMDTDSIMSFKEYKDADAFILGGLKLENTIDAFKVLAPKCYGYRDKETHEIEIHSKGISKKSIEKYALNNNITLKDIDDLNKIYEYDNKYITTTCCNVVGGKIILPIEKILAKEELRPLTLNKNNDIVIYENGNEIEL